MSSPTPTAEERARAVVTLLAAWDKHPPALGLDTITSLFLAAEAAAREAQKAKDAAELTEARADVERLTDANLFARMVLCGFRETSEEQDDRDSAYAAIDKLDVAARTQESTKP